MTQTQKTATFCNDPKDSLDFLNSGIFDISSYDKTGQMINLMIVYI